MIWLNLFQSVSRGSGWICRLRVSARSKHSKLEAEVIFPLATGDVLLIVLFLQNFSLIVGGVCEKGSPVPTLPGGGRGRLPSGNSNGHQGTSCRAAQTTPGARILFKPDQVPRSQDGQKSCKLKQKKNTSKLKLEYFSTY